MTDPRRLTLKLWCNLNVVESVVACYHKALVPLHWRPWLSDAVGTEGLISARDLVKHVDYERSYLGVSAAGRSPAADLNHCLGSGDTIVGRDGSGGTGEAGLPRSPFGVHQ